MIGILRIAYPTLAITLGVLVLSFLLLHWIPGDPSSALLGESAQLADTLSLKQSLGLQQPIWQQLAHYLMQLAQGDFGYSWHSKQAIAPLLVMRYWATAQLTCMALLIAVGMGIPLGIYAALRKGRWQDIVITLITARLSAMPVFCLAPLLILIFAVWLPLLPISGMEQLGSIILPSLTLGLVLSAVITRITRTSTLEVLHEHFIRTARAKGLPRLHIITHHVLRTALLPLITVISLQMGSLLSGALVTETIFGWDGIGSLLVESIEKRDYPVTQACVVLISVSYVLINLFTDCLYQWADPRVNLQDR